MLRQVDKLQATKLMSELLVTYHHRTFTSTSSANHTNCRKVSTIIITTPFSPGLMDIVSPFNTGGKSGL